MGEEQSGVALVNGELSVGVFILCSSDDFKLFPFLQLVPGGEGPEV